LGGNDVIIVTVKDGGSYPSRETTIYDRAGNDTNCVFPSFLTDYSGSGNDWIRGKGPDGYERAVQRRNLTTGFAKGTTIVGRGLLGGSGDDYVAIGDLIDGGPGNDKLHFASEIYGGAGNDGLQNGGYCDGGSGTGTAISCETSTRADKVQSSPV
jgi:hypothetical protein